MPYSNYEGFANGITIANVPVTMTNPGNVFWVDSGTGSNNHKGTYQRPFATIDYAIGRCTASNGDIIFVKPGHAETISAAGGITMDVIGVAVIGLGKGSIRPTVTLDTATTSTFLMSAADCTVSNVLFKANFADIVTMINVTATDAHIDSCEFIAQATNMNWVDVIDASGADDTADGLTITNCSAYGVDGLNDSFLEITGNISRLTVLDCDVVYSTSNAQALIEHTGSKVMTNVNIQRNVYWMANTAGDILISNGASTNTGTVAHNLASHRDTATEILVDATGVGCFENYGTAIADKSGFLLPAADS